MLYPSQASRDSGLSIMNVHTAYISSFMDPLLTLGISSLYANPKGKFLNDLGLRSAVTTQSSYKPLCYGILYN